MNVINSKRKRDLQTAKLNLTEAYKKVNDAWNDEQEAYDNMPDNLKCSSNAALMNDAIHYMGEAIDHIDKAVVSINSIIED